MTAKKRLKKYFKKWEYAVLAYGWKFEVNYCAGSDDMPDGVSPNCLAVTYTEFRYLKARIYFNLCRAANESDDDLEGAVIHELTHLLLSPMQDDNGVQNSEYCTTVVSRLLKGLRDSK